MNDDINVRKLVEFIFIKKFKIPSEPDSSFPSCLQANDFPQKLRYILLTRQAMVRDKWRSLFDNYKSDKPITFEEVLKSIMVACLVEHSGEKKVFGSFITACSLVRYFGTKIFTVHYGDYSLLSCDIIMEFYKSVLKKSFRKVGGFQRVVDYIHHHEYHAWSLDMKELLSYDEDSGPISVQTTEKLKKESNKELEMQKAACFGSVDMNELYDFGCILASNVSSVTAVRLLVDAQNPKREEASNQNDKAKTPEIKRDQNSKHLEEVSPRNSRSNERSKTTDIPEQKDDVWLENIVQAIRKYNQLENAILTSSGKHILKEVEEILKHLRNTIESLLNVLDRYDKE